MTPQTAPWSSATAVELGQAAGQDRHRRQRRAGLLHDRASSAPYLNEAAHLLVEGAAIDAIDARATAWGFPVGPVHAARRGGHRRGRKGRQGPARGVRGADGAARDDGSPGRGGRLGRKAKKGFYTYDVKGKRVDTACTRRSRRRDRGCRPGGGAARAAVLAPAQRGGSLPGRRASCASARDGDVGAIFGLGFPPFRGGPFRDVDAIGPRSCSTGWSAGTTAGVRFEPAALLRRMAERGERFHPD